MNFYDLAQISQPIQLSLWQSIISVLISLLLFAMVVIQLEAQDNRQLSRDRSIDQFIAAHYKLAFLNLFKHSFSNIHLPKLKTINWLVLFKKRR